MGGILVHEWIERSGGAEKVLDVFADMFPGADITCLWNDAPQRYQGRPVRQSPLAMTPLRDRKALALPAMPIAWRTVQNRAYDWAVVSSYAFAHHVRFRGQGPGFRKFVYVHSPARYLWSPDVDSRGRSALVRTVAPAFKGLDRYRSRETVSMAANSRFVRDRIRESWHRDARVIHPPVDVRGIAAVPDWRALVVGEERAVLDALPPDFLLGASRFVEYKRLDRVIAAGEAVGLPVVLAGRGPDLPHLRRSAAEARVPVTVVESPSDALLRALLQTALVLVFPPVEDFGIMPVEAMAAGTPVVGNHTGGTAETVVDGITGVLTDFRGSSYDLARAVTTAAATSADRCVARAREFDTSVFRARAEEWLAGIAGRTSAPGRVA